MTKTMSKKTKATLMILSLVFTAMVPICMAQASTEGLEWLFYVGTFLSIAGLAITQVVRESMKPDPVPSPGSEEEEIKVVVEVIDGE